MLFLAGLSWRWVCRRRARSPRRSARPGARRRPTAASACSSFLDPEHDPLGSGFQALQSLIAVGSGGVVGLGPGKSLQKLYFLPYPHSDFIYAIVAEELGMIGALGVVALFALLLWRGVRAGWRAPDALGRYLAWGLTTVIVIQALLNISVAIALLPTKGIPLPFLSYGGSSLVVVARRLRRAAQRVAAWLRARCRTRTLRAPSSSPAAARAGTSSRRSRSARSSRGGGGA